MSGTTTDPGDKSSAEIETEVERSRARVTETMDALRGKMSPGQITEQVLDYARSSGGAEFFQNLGTSVRENPLPVTLIGAGIAWLLVSGTPKGGGSGTARAAPGPYPALPPPDRSSSSGPGLGETVARTVGRATARVSDVAGDLRNRTQAGVGAAGDAASRVTDLASDLAGGASQAAGRVADAAGDAASRVAEVGSDLADRASGAASRATGAVRALVHDATDAVSGGTGEAAGRARQGWDRMLTEQPLLVGALGLAVGAALGALLPRTRTEDRLMGESSDAVTEQVGAVAREGYERVKDTAGEHLGRAGEALADTYEDSKERLGREGSSVAAVGDVLGRAVGEVTKVATDAARSLAEEAKGDIEAAGEKARGLTGGAEPSRGASTPAPATPTPTTPPARPLAAPAIVPPRPAMDGKPDPV